MEPIVEPAKCEHDWKKYKETLHRTRTPAEARREARAYQLNPEARHVEQYVAFFIWQGCIKCKTKRLVGYKTGGGAV